MLGQFLVHWLTMLLVHDNLVVTATLSPATLIRVGKIFSLVSRFAGSRRTSMTDPESPIDQLAKEICGTDFRDFCPNLFASGSIPKVFNKGIVEHHVVFWWLLTDSQRRDMVPQILSLIPSTDSGHSHDDIHCTVLEFFASSSWACSEYVEWGSFLKKEITRGDSSMIPSIATAVRLSVGMIGVPLLEEASATEAGASEWLRWMTDFLLSNLETDTYRFLSVLNHAILLDPKMCEQLLVSGQTFSPLVDYEKFRQANDQVREVFSAAIGRLARVDSHIAGVVRTELERVLANPIADERESAKQKVSVLKALGRFIRFSRAMPEWCVGGLRLALDLVPSYQDDVRQAGMAFIDLVARFLGVEKALCLPIDQNASPKEIDTIVSLKVRVLVKAIEQKETDMSAVEFVKKFQENVTVDPSMQSSILTAYKSGLSDLLVLVPEKEIEKWMKELSSYGLAGHLLGLCAVVSLSSLYHDFPPVGIKAIKNLATMIETQLDPNIRKIAETTVSELLKILSDRGSRDRAEKLLDDQTLSIIKSGRAKQSYIS